MGPIDTTILFAYLGLMIGLGFYANYRQKNVDDYFVAGRRMGPFTIATLWLAAWVGGAAVVGSSARTYEMGVTGVWYIASLAIGCLLFGLFMSRKVKDLGDRHGHLTYPDFIEERFDQRTRIVATVTTVLAYIAYSAGQLVASAAILQVLLGWDYNAALLLAAGIVIVYTATGGYLAVTYTDWVQFVLLIAGIVVIGMPIAISQAGNWSELQSALPATYFDLGAQGWGNVLALVTSIVLSFFVAMDSYSRCFAARDGRAARNGTLLAVLFVVPLAIASVWLGLASAVLFPEAESSNGILTTFILETFPVGLKGLVLVGRSGRGDVLGRYLHSDRIGQLHARHSPAIHSARYPAAADAAAEHCGIPDRRPAGHRDGLEDAGHHRHSAARFHDQLGRPVPAHRGCPVLEAGGCIRRVLEHLPGAGHGGRLAGDGGLRNGWAVQHRSPVARAERIRRCVAAAEPACPTCQGAFSCLKFWPSRLFFSALP